MDRSIQYAFVLPRFGEGIIGGAETLAGSLAAKIAADGSKVEVFTTCARDNRSWENSFPVGTSLEFGLPVHRYKVDERNLESWIPKQIRIAEGMRLSVDEQLEWLEEGVNSKDLYGALVSRAQEFDAIFFAPYLFATTFWGSMVVKDRAFLIPCLHDENYAYLETIASMMGQVRGLLFNSLPEEKLARRLYGDLKGGEVGMGFDPIASHEVKLLSPFFKDSFPYIVYVGRKETGKNVQVLIDYFMILKDSCCEAEQLKLVIVGGGDFADLERPHAAGRDDILDLSHLSENEKRSVIRNALALVQPSRNESFSIVLMEAWRLSVPVLVDAHCAVTQNHVEESGGGLYYDGSGEFCEVIKLMLTDRSLRKSMGEAGARYVSTKYSWPSVLQRFNAVMESFGIV